MEGTAFAGSIAVEECGDAFAGDGIAAAGPAPEFATTTAAIITVTPTKAATAAVTPSRVGNPNLLTLSLPPQVSDRKVHIQLPTVITLKLIYAAKRAGKLACLAQHFLVRRG